MQNQSTQLPLKTFVMKSIKLLVAGGLLFLLFRMGAIDTHKAIELRNHPFAILLIMLAYIVSIFLCCLRWHHLMKILDISLPLKKTIQIYFIGLFGNNFLPGGAGGDALRVAYTKLYSKKSSGRIFFSVLTDRVLGLFGLVILTMIMIPFYWESFTNGPMRTIFFLLFGGFLGGIFALTSLFIFSRKLQLRARIKKLGKHAILDFVMQVLNIVREYRKYPLMIIGTLILSVIIQSIIIISVASIASLYKMGSLNLGQYMIAAALGMFTNIIPISPGGIGVGETAFNYVCQFFSPHTGNLMPYATAFLLFRIIISTINLIGVFFFITYKSASHGVMATDNAAPLHVNHTN